MRSCDPNRIKILIPWTRNVLDVKGGGKRDVDLMSDRISIVNRVRRITSDANRKYAQSCVGSSCLLTKRRPVL